MSVRGEKVRNQKDSEHTNAFKILSEYLSEGGSAHLLLLWEDSKKLQDSRQTTSEETRMSLREYLKTRLRSLRKLYRDMSDEERVRVNGEIEARISALQAFLDDKKAPEALRNGARSALDSIKLVRKVLNREAATK